MPAAPRRLGPHYRWLVLLVMSLICFAQYFIYDSITPLGTMIKEQLGFSSSQYGLLFSFYSVANVFFLMVLLGGVLVDKLGIKVSGILYGSLCVLGAALTALGAWSGLPAALGPFYGWLHHGFVPGVRPELKIMLLGRMIFGVGAESILVVNNKALARWFRGKELAFAYGLNLTVMRLGTYLALVMQAKVAHRLGLQAALWGAAAVMALGLLFFLGYLLLERGARGRAGAPEPERPGLSPTTSATDDRFELRQAFSFDASFWFITLLCVTFYSAVFPFQSFAPDILVQKFHYSEERAGWITSALIVGTMIFTPIFGHFVDRRGRRATMMLWGALLLVPCHLLIAFTTLPPVVPIFLVGVALSLVPAALWAAVPLMVAEKRLGTAFGVVGYVQNVGLMLFPWLAGRIADAHTTLRVVDGKEVAIVDYRYTMVMFAALGIAGLVFAVLLERADRRKGSPLQRPRAAAG